MRPVFASASGATSTTTPSALPFKAPPPALPQAVQAYAASPSPEASSSQQLVSGSGATPSASKIQARLASLEPVVIANPDPVVTAKPEPVRSEGPKAASKPETAELGRETVRPALTAWVIQLGAMDDEGKAKAVLDEARTRSGRMLAKASAFTEKVVREGATLYRARFSGFQEADSAQEACKSLKRNGFNCFATRS
jgi:D-alanyl-D-alanine carboxypeptidase